MHLKPVVNLVLRLALGAYLSLAASYKLFAPAAVLAALARTPIGGDLPVGAQRAIVGLLIGGEASLAICLLANRRVRLVCVAFVLLLIVVTLAVVSAGINPSSCACNWSWMPLAPKTRLELIGRNSFLTLLALSLLFLRDTADGNGATKGTQPDAAGPMAPKCPAPEAR